MIPILPRFSSSICVHLRLDTHVAPDREQVLLPMTMQRREPAGQAHSRQELPLVFNANYLPSIPLLLITMHVLQRPVCPLC